MNWLYIILLFHPAIITAEQGSCRAAKRCCDGKDSECVVQKTPMNEIIEDLSEDEPCYCDHGCLDVGDCCPDFKDYCGGEYCLNFPPKLVMIVHRSRTYFCLHGCSELWA